MRIPLKSMKKGFLAGGLLCIMAFVWVKYRHLMSFKALKDSKSEVDAFVERDPIVAGLSYTFLMTLIIGLTLPGATFLSLTGGVFFPQPYAAMCTYCGYVFGASLSYTMVRFFIGDYVKAYLSSKSSHFDTFQKGFEESKKKSVLEVVTFLIFVRYVAFFPFWLVNSACALMGIGFGYFLFTTALATVPGSLIYTLSGNVLADTLDAVPEDAKVSEVFMELAKQVVLEPWGLLYLVGEETSSKFSSGSSKKSGYNVLILPLFGFCAFFPLVLWAKKKLLEGPEEKKTRQSGKKVQNAKKSSREASRSPKGRSSSGKSPTSMKMARKSKK